jgi:hypothetical protein
MKGKIPSRFYSISDTSSLTSPLLISDLSAEVIEDEKKQQYPCGKNSGVKMIPLWKIFLDDDNEYK